MRTEAGQFYVWWKLPRNLTRLGISPANLCLHAESAVDRKRDGECASQSMSSMVWFARMQWGGGLQGGPWGDSFKRLYWVTEPFWLNMIAEPAQGRSTGHYAESSPLRCPSRGWNGTHEQLPFIAVQDRVGVPVSCTPHNLTTWKRRKWDCSCSLNRKSFTISKGNWNITDIVWKIREVVSWPGGSKLPSQQPKGGSYLT